MTSKAEQVASRCLRSVVAGRAEGAQIEESSELEKLLSALEVFLPTVLCESYPGPWRHESFDGFRFAVARKTGPFEAELLGLCLLISDQTWTPMHVRLRAAADADSLSWVLCRVGSRAGEGAELTRLPYGSSKVSKLLYAVSEQPENIAWAFTAERQTVRRQT